MPARNAGILKDFTKPKFTKSWFETMITYFLVNNLSLINGVCYSGVIKLKVNAGKPGKTLVSHDAHQDFCRYSTVSQSVIGIPTSWLVRYHWSGIGPALP
jgi:hypothetical protein